MAPKQGYAKGRRDQRIDAGLTHQHTILPVPAPVQHTPAGVYSDALSLSLCAQISAESGHPVVRVNEKNYMFRLSALQQPLEEWLGITQNTPAPADTSDSAIHSASWKPPVYPPGRWNETAAFVKRGLRDISVSRATDRVPWGIPVPGDPSQTVYVWLDALSNYLTVTGWPERPAGRPGSHWPADVHVVGKDILRFHAVFWPAFLIAAGLPPPRCILSHGHWTVNKASMGSRHG